MMDLPITWRLVPLEGKSPKLPRWNLRENTVSAEFPPAGNVGLAHAYSGTCAFDIDDLEKTRAIFGAESVDALFDDPCSVQIVSGKPNRAKFLFSLPTPMRTISRGAYELRCAAADGKTVQDVIPPSLHPDTGQPYQWLLGPAADLYDLPQLPEWLKGHWEEQVRAPEKITGQHADGMSIDECEALLARIDPNDLDYDRWLDVGMALHYELGPEAFEMFNTWSRRTTKVKKETGRPIYDARKTKASWASFGKYNGPPVTGNKLKMLASMPTPEAFEDLGPDPEEKPKKKAKFRVIDAVDVKPPKVTWAIKGVLPAHGVSSLYGEPGSGKSFVGLDMAMSIARGLPWCGHTVKQHLVVYIFAESHGGAADRMQAYARHNGIDLKDVPSFGVIAAAPNMLKDEQGALLEAALEWRARRPPELQHLPVLTVGDTLARMTPGANENTSEEMGKAIAALEYVAQGLGGPFLTITHMGKDASKGVRGWSGINAALEAAIAVERTGETRNILVTKQKDGEDGLKMYFRLGSVGLGDDDDGEPKTSCYVDWNVEPPVKVETLGPVQEAIMTAVHALITHKGSANFQELIFEMRRAAPDKKIEPKNVRRTVVELAKKNKLVFFNDSISLPEGLA